MEKMFHFPGVPVSVQKFLVSEAAVQFITDGTCPGSFKRFLSLEHATRDDIPPLTA